MMRLCEHCEEAPVRTSKNRFCSHACYAASSASTNREGLASGEKRCGRCRAIKPVEDFSPCSKGDGRHGWCKLCRSKDEAQRRADAGRIQTHQDRYGSDLEYRARQILRNIVKRSRRQGLDCDLTVDWLAQRFAGRCELSGVQLELTTASRPGPRTPSVDRIRASGGYTMANCRVICHALNWALANWGVDAFLPIAEGFVERARLSDAA